METLRINTPFNKQDFLKAQSMRWRISWMENRKQLISLSISTVVLLGLGFLMSTKENPISLLLLIGFGFFAILSLLFYSRMFAKRKFNKEAQKIAERFEKMQMDCKYEFSNDAVKYWDKEKHFSFTWAVFTHYSIYKDLLMLYIGNSVIDFFMFERNGTKLEIEQFDKIMEFTKAKLTYKEI